MKKADLTYVTGSAFIALTSVCYCATQWFGIPLPRYYPLEHSWKWVNEQGIPSQAWYGMQGFAFLAAGLFSLALYAILRRATPAGSSLKPITTRVVAVITLLVVLGCMGYLLGHEFTKWGVVP